MKLNSIEKIIVAILVLGGILAAGIFLFIVPAYDKIGVATKKYDSLLMEKAELDAELARESTIDGEISDAKKEAKKLEGNFYPDLTTYEASEIALAYLADNNLSTYGIAINDITVESLSLEAYRPTPVLYNLKSYSQSAKGIDENALLEGQFKDGSKVYTITASKINDITITDSDGNLIEKNKYTDTMKKAYRQALCEFVMDNGLYHDVAQLTVTYKVKGTYKDFLGFLDYINDLDKASRLEKIDIPMTAEMAVETDDNGYSEDPFSSKAPEKEIRPYEDDTIVEENTVTLVLLCAEPMDELESMQAGGEKIVLNQ